MLEAQEDAAAAQVMPQQSRSLVFVVGDALGCVPVPTTDLRVRGDMFTHSGSATRRVESERRTSPSESGSGCASRLRWTKRSGKPTLGSCSRSWV